MSKTSQRKRQAYTEGLGDGQRGDGFRWKRHPFIQDYRRGFHQGCEWRRAWQGEAAIARRWYMRLLAAIACRMSR